MSASVEISSERRRKTDAHLDEAQEFHDETTQRDHLPKNVEVFQIVGPLFFGVAGEVMDTFKAIGSAPKVLILRMRYVPYLDTTGVGVLEKIAKSCEQAGSKLILSGLQKQPLAILERGHLHSGEHGVYFTANYDDALALSKKIASGESLA